MKIGVVGCGKIADRHLHAYKKLGTEVVVTDVDEARAKLKAHELGDEDVDAIDVCVPTPHHAGVVLAGLAAGKHAFCEKPLCRTYAEAVEIAEAQERSDRIVMVGYLYRFYPAFQFVKEVLDDGIIGSPYTAILRVGGRGSAAAWKHRDDLGGGAVFEMLVHNLDLALWFFGPIVGVEVLWRARLLPIREVGDEIVEADADDAVVVRLRTESGVDILCQADLCTPSYMNYLEIQGDNGSLFSSMLHYLPTIVYCKHERGIFNQGNNFYEFPTVNVFEPELKHFIDALRSARDVPSGLDASLEIMRLVDQINTQRHGG